MFQQAPKAFSQRPENMKSITIYSLQKLYFASKCCSRNAECCFDNTGQTFPGRSPRVFSSESGNEKKFSSQKAPVKSWKATFGNPSGIFLLTKLEHSKKPISFVPENFPKMYHWTHRSKFWQQCWKTFARVNWVSAQIPKKMNPKKLQFFLFYRK